MILMLNLPGQTSFRSFILFFFFFDFDFGEEWILIFFSRRGDVRKKNFVERGPYFLTIR